ncbi:MAG: hypothetical protein IIC90_08055 [Chloroflexi bacterium]|nr:hypothetical protein [Chloroflexota bacterium]
MEPEDIVGFDGADFPFPWRHPKLAVPDPDPKEPDSVKGSRRPRKFWNRRPTNSYEQPITVGLMLGFTLVSYSSEGKMFGRQELYH